MGIDNYITDPQNHKNAHVVHINGSDDNVDYINKNALVVATHPLKIYENTIKYFTSSVFGIDMNIGQTISFTENVHDGIDHLYWTASIIVGDKWTINSTDQNHTVIGGSQSIKYDNGDTNDILQITNDSDFLLTNYDILNIWIYVDKDWAAGDSVAVYGWDTGIEVIIGDSVNLENYFTFNIFDVWQKIAIPLVDMNLTGKILDSIRIEIITKDGKSPKMYMDDIQFTGIIEEAGSGEFIIEPELETWLHVNSFQILMADEYAGTFLDGTMPNIPYNSLLGVPKLDSGIIYKRIINEEVIFSASIKQFLDFLAFNNAIVTGNGSDGTNTWVSINIRFIEPVILKSENNDKMSLSVNDNLSGLLLLRVGAGCKVEQR